VGADPALTAHGVDQANELAVRLLELDPPIERVYSSLYYRCLQTVEPFVRKTQEVVQELKEETAASSPPASSSSSTTVSAAVTTSGDGGGAPCGSGGSGSAAAQRPPWPLKIRGETGLGEWYGSANFDHPVPAPLGKLAELFPGLLELDYRPAVTPNRKGESIEELHERVAAALEALIAECDRDGVRAVLLCSHAAVIIALGRVLTGHMPDSYDVEDFKCFTCGLSAYRRRQRESGSGSASADGTNVAHGHRDGPARDWRDGRGVSGGWDCELNSDCRHLRLGEERGWYV
jgi:transcription factor C subunit 7